MSLTLDWREKKIETVYLTACLSLSTSLCLYVCMSVCLSACRLYVHRAICLYVFMPVRLNIDLFARVSVCMSVHLYAVCLCVCIVIVIVIVIEHLYSATHISGASNPHQCQHRQKGRFSGVYGTREERGQEALGEETRVHSFKQRGPHRRNS